MNTPAAIRRLGHSYCTCGHTGYQHFPTRFLGQCGECTCNWFERERVPVRSFLGALLAWIVGAP
jgi:hypothetical protein